jgi:hypothetical protein
VQSFLRLVRLSSRGRRGVAADLPMLWPERVRVHSIRRRAPTVPGRAWSTDLSEPQSLDRCRQRWRLVAPFNCWMAYSRLQRAEGLRSAPLVRQHWHDNTPLPVAAPRSISDFGSSAVGPSSCYQTLVTGSRRMRGLTSGGNRIRTIGPASGKVVDAKFRRSDPARSNTDFGRRC